MSVTTLNGVIQKVFWDNKHTGQCGMVIKAVDKNSAKNISDAKKGKNEITVVGTYFNPKVGEHVTTDGEFKPHNKYGMQFVGKTIVPTATMKKSFPNEIVTSNIFRFVRKSKRKQIAEMYGDKCLSVLMLYSNDLKKKNIINETEYNYVNKNRPVLFSLIKQYNFLRGTGISAKQSRNILDSYKSIAIEVAATNPYHLLDTQGIGYAAVDKIAESIGISMDSDIRVKSVLLYSSNNKFNQGSSAFKLNGMCQQLSKQLKLPEEKIKTDYLNMSKDGTCLVEDDGDGDHTVFNFQLRRKEVGCAKYIKRIMSTPFSDKIPNPYGMPGFLNDGQLNAIHKTLQSKLSIITGGPGVGKTTVVNTVVEQIKQLQGTSHRVVMAAPTGKAARRMTESTGHEAETIHTTLEYDETGTFKRDSRNALKADTVIIDESSMMDISLFLSLLQAIPAHARVIFVGDVDQLPSVGPGAVLQDMITSNTIPVSVLDETMRQAADSHIIKNAHAINKGEMPNLNNEDNSDFQWMPASTPEDINEIIKKTVLRLTLTKEFDVNDIQVLSPMGSHASGVNQLNTDLRDIMNPERNHGGQYISVFGTDFRLNDRVMQTKNDKTLKISNGDVGIIKSINHSKQSVLVDFDGREVEMLTSKMGHLHLAYAKTIHKSQGSEYGAVIIPVCDTHANMLTRQLLYTAITRGKKKVYLVGSENALNIAVSNIKKEVRETFLDKALVSEIGTIEYNQSVAYAREAQEATHAI